MTPRVIAAVDLYKANYRWMTHHVQHAICELLDSMTERETDQYYSAVVEYRDALRRAEELSEWGWAAESPQLLQKSIGTKATRSRSTRMDSRTSST